jgi:hypothetical protein
VGMCTRDQNKHAYIQVDAFMACACTKEHMRTGFGISKTGMKRTSMRMKCDDGDATRAYAPRLGKYEYNIYRLAYAHACIFKHTSCCKLLGVGICGENPVHPHISLRKKLCASAYFDVKAADLDIPMDDDGISIVQEVEGARNI